MKKGLLALLSLVVLNIVLISAGNQTKKIWDIPDTYKSMKNPIKVSSIGIDDAKGLWNKECKSCHGSLGKGDGVKAKKIGKSYGDLSSTEFQSQLTDGGIYYLSFVNKISEHHFEKKLPDDMDRWNIVHYIRTF